MTHIFISYAREDRETAERLARALAGHGWAVWWDRDIPAGQAFDRVIEALPTLGAETHLYLIGPDGRFAQGDQTAELMRLADNRGVRDRVHLVGEIANADLPFWYNAADVFCLSSKDEGTPNVLCEALACGCPVISTDCPGGSAEILENGKYGPLVSVGDPVALSEAIVSMLDNPVDRAMLLQRADTFSVQRSADRYLELLDKLALRSGIRS